MKFGRRVKREPISIPEQRLVSVPQGLISRVVAKPIVKKENPDQDVYDMYGHFLKHSFDGLQRRCVYCNRWSIKVCNICDVPLHIECLNSWHSENKWKSEDGVFHMNIQ